MRLAMRLALFAPIAALAASANSGDTIKYDRDIRPILSENCFYCHGMDPNKRKAKLRLDERESAVVVKKVIAPGNPQESEVIKRIFSTNSDEQMPPPDSNRHLNPRQKEILRAWIQKGAQYQQHWAFIAPTRPKIPSVKHKKWPRNPIDNFILAHLEAEKLSPQPEAPTEKLLRRVSFDLSGLPPTYEQLKHWLAAKDPYATAVDELLASPHFGERLAADWMDVARYADTHGFNNDSSRSMWRWRDWVIAAFNKNLPYNEFITEQLAGDLLKKPTLDQRIATAFNRNHVINSEGGIIDEEYRVEYVIDRVQTTATAWMGLTVGCARCHDHKFDPVTQKDFYSFFAFFNSIDENGEDGRVANAAPILSTPTAEQQAAIKLNRAKMDAARETMNQFPNPENDWNGVALDLDVDYKKRANLFPATNRILSFDLSSVSSTNNSIRNSAGGKPFHVSGTVIVTNGPLWDRNALLLDGRTSLKTDELPKVDAGKAWAFATWLRCDSSNEAPLFSTMNFGVPPSSAQYGDGIEIRVTASGAIEARVALRWPGYSLDAVTRETIYMGQQAHVLVTFDGKPSAKGLRIFLDGHECFLNVIHDDAQSVPGVSGRAFIGTSGLKNAPVFKGLLASTIMGPLNTNPEALAAEVREDVWRFEGRVGGTMNILKLRERWLRKHRPEFAKAADEYDATRNALLELDREAPTTMVMSEMPKPRPTFVLFRGQYDQHRDKVQPDVPEFLLGYPKNAPRNRLGLAEWLTDPKNPLTARVVVNRFWQSVFGIGIVKTPGDFGYQADWPTHPELLDWLAVEFVQSGWDVKHLLKLMVTSAAYRQDSRSTPELNERDPENTLLAHGPRRRLTAEELRDEALSLSGLLSDHIGGPSVFPYQPANLYKGIIVAADYPGTKWVESKGDDLYRRSLYTFWKRTVPNPTLSTFDAPDREVCVARRLRTNTPLQALALMNDIIRLETARKLAERMIEVGDKPNARIAYAFELATGRKPDRAESKSLDALLQDSLAHFQGNRKGAEEFLAAGESKRNTKLDTAELAAYTDVASLILNLDETITIN